jgi:hypothetical protein
MITSKYEKYLVRKPVYELSPSIKNRQSPAMTYMSSTQVPEANYHLEFGWVYGIPDPNPPVPEQVHDTEEIVLYIGGDPQNPEDLGGEIELRVGGKPVTFDSSAALFVPKGVRHGPVTWKKFRKPHIEMTLRIAGSIKDDRSNVPGLKNNNNLFQVQDSIDPEKYLVRKPVYERAMGVKNRQSPTMTYLSSNQIPEANYYIEFGWIYGIPDPNPPVTQHVHQHDEMILHFGGDPQNPEDLGAEIEVRVEGEPLLFDTNTALFAPKGLTHCPVTWKKFKKPHIEMAITLGYGKR